MAVLVKYRDTLCKFKISLASMLVILGGLAQMYVIIIGGQAYPLILFPGMEVESSFFDGVINAYTPSLPEILLGLGGTAIADSDNALTQFETDHTSVYYFPRGDVRMDLLEATDHDSF